MTNETKIKYYSFCKGRGKVQHRIRMQKFKIERYFATLCEAKNFSEQIVAQVKVLGKVQKALIADDYSHQLVKADYQEVLESIPDLITEIDNMLAPIDRDATLSIDQARRSNTLSVREMVELYVDAKNKSLNPIGTGDMSKYRHWMTCKLGKTMVSKLNAQAIRDEHVALAKAKTKSTANRYLTELSAAWTYMMENKLCPGVDHVVREVKKHKEKTNHTMAYRKEEVEQLIKIAYAADERAKGQNEPTFMFLGPLIEIFSLTGIRNQFLTKLRWDDLHRDGNVTYIVMPMKGEKMVRVPLSDRVLEILNGLEDDSYQDYVFPNAKMNNTPAQDWTTRFKRLITANNKVEGEQKVRESKKPIHSFRAWVATRLAQNGASVINIADMLGVSIPVAMGYRERSGVEDENLVKMLNAF